MLSLRMGSWPLSLGLYISWFTSISLSLLHLFAPSFFSFTSSISVFSYGQEAFSFFSSDSDMIFLFGLALFALLHVFKTLKTNKKFLKAFFNRAASRFALASPSTQRHRQAVLAVELLQISSGMPRFLFISAKHVVASRHYNLTGLLTFFDITDTSSFRYCLMFSRLVVSVGVILAFGPVFAAFALALIPGKENRPFPPVETRRPLSSVGQTSFKDISRQGLNLWAIITCHCRCRFPSAEASVSPQACKDGKPPSWTSGHLSIRHTLNVTTNSLCLVLPESRHRVAHYAPTRVLPSPWGGRCYGSWNCSFEPLLLLLQFSFPALSRVLLQSPWSYAAPVSKSPKFQAVSRNDNLMDEDPENDSEISSGEESDESDDAITSYAGSAPNSPICSFSRPSSIPTVVHPDNSQFSTLAHVGTPTIIRQAQSMVTSSPSIIRDARLLSVPYTSSHERAGSGSNSRQSSNPPTRPPSRSAPLPTTAADFGLPPSTATILPSVVENAPRAITPPALPQPRTPERIFFNKVTIPDPSITPTMKGLVPEEWAAFKKAVLEYNLSLDLYKPDLDWKKDNMQEPKDPANLADYHLRIGRVNQRVGAIALMERAIGQYILTVGRELAAAQAKEDNLPLPPDDIDWYITQGTKNTSQLLEHKHVPQEDIAPALYLPPLLATPVPTAEIVLVPETPVSDLTPLNTSPSSKIPSPAVSALDTPVMRSLPQVLDTSATPKPSAMDILPPQAVADVTTLTPSSQQIIRPMVPDAHMTDAQKERVDEVLKEYKKQESAALQRLHDTRQRTRDAEITLALEKAKVRKAELLAEHIRTNEITRNSPPHSVSSSYVPPSQRSDSEATTAMTQSHLFAPTPLSSISSGLLPIPSRPNAPVGLAATAPQPIPAAAGSTSKGKQRAQSHDDFQDFVFPLGWLGFTSLQDRLIQLQDPLQDALSIASMENSEFTSLRTDLARQLLQLVDTLVKVNARASKSIDHCPAAAQLPPYPALGLEIGRASCRERV